MKALRVERDKHEVGADSGSGEGDGEGARGGMFNIYATQVHCK